MWLRRRSGQRLWLPAQSEVDDALDERVVGESGRLRRRREILTLRNLRIRIGLDHPRTPFGVEPQVDARIGAQLQRPERALADVLDGVDRGWWQSMRGTAVDA